MKVEVCSTEQHGNYIFWGTQREFSLSFNTTKAGFLSVRKSVSDRESETIWLWLMPRTRFLIVAGSRCVPVSLSVSIILPLCPSVWLVVYLYACESFFVYHFFLSICLVVCLFICRSACFYHPSFLSVCLGACLSIRLSVCLFLSFFLSVPPSVCLCVCLVLVAQREWPSNLSCWVRTRESCLISPFRSRTLQTILPFCASFHPFLPPPLKQ